MKQVLSAAVMACAAAVMGVVPQFTLAQSSPTTQPAQAEVPVKIVSLFSSGVGYFEHAGTVDGNAATELRFKTSQINDILKSLVLQDMDNGQISTVTYPSQDPLAKTLRSFQVDITSNPSLADLLNQLRGAKVAVDIQGEQYKGTILGVEKKNRPSGKDTPPIQVAVMNLLTGGSLRAIELDQVQDIQLEDPQLQEELHKALLALAQARDQDKKPVIINFTGQGQRRVKVGYVVETPVWKTSYRLILSGNPEIKPKLQGWAIVENQTDNDWNNVQLSLISGRPISFIQNLYQPLYIPRPVVEPELYASLKPQAYEEGMARREVADQFNRPATVSSPMPLRLEGAKQKAVGGLAYTNEPMNAAASVSSAASASKLGELFQYTVSTPVSLPRQRSAMIPIITDDVAVERVSIYNADVLPRNPLNGAQLKNTTDKHLLQGPITVLDANNYAGDARINDVPPGQERLLSYGIDLQMLVNSKDKQEEAILTGKIVKGVLEVARKSIFTQDYTSENKSDHEKTLIIEHPFRQGWKLVSELKPFETTDSLYRFKGTVAPGKSNKLTVQEEFVQWDRIELIPADMDQLAIYMRQGQIPKEVKDALTKAMELKQTVVNTQRQIAETAQKINETATAQQRTRENMKAIAPSAQNGDYYTRLLKRMADQDAQIDQMQKAKDDLDQQLQQQRKQLEDYLNGLNIG